MELEIVALFLRLLFACYKSSSEIIIINGTYEAVFPFTFKRIELKNFSNKFHLNWFNGICEQQQQQLDSSNNNMKERNSKRLKKKSFYFSCSFKPNSKYKCSCLDFNTLACAAHVVAAQQATCIHVYVFIPEFFTVGIRNQTASNKS
jgi:hypothetical protein